jgi:hypothetical protein
MRNKIFRLADNEVRDILTDTSCDPSKYAISIFLDKEEEVLVVGRADGSVVEIPTSLFNVSGDGTVPDFNNVSIADCGQTIQLGDYEACAEYMFELTTAN